MALSTTVYRGTDGRSWIDVNANKTLVAADSGLVQNVIADNVTVTLPATVVGLHYIIRNGGVATTGAAVGTGSNGTALVLTMPTGTDGFTGAAITAAASKGMNNTKATSSVGDEIQLKGTGVNSAVAWVISNLIGTWARTA